MWSETGGWGWGWIGLGFVHMALFWVLLIVAIVALVRGISGGTGESRTAEKSALDILKERYASGEIEREEFEQRKQDLLK